MDQTSIDNTAVKAGRPFPQVAPGKLWLMWLLGNGVAAGLIIPLAIALLTALQQPMAASPAAFQVVQWLTIVLAAGAIALASAFVMRRYTSRPRLWFLLTWAAWAVALVYPTTPLFFQYYNAGSSVPASIQFYSQAASILSAVIKFVIVAFAQWLILRIDYRKTWTWMLWSLLGIAISVGILLALIYVFHLDTFLASLGDTQIYTWISNGGTYLVAFAVSGLGLAGILNHPEPDPAEHEAGRVIAAEWVGAGLAYAVLLSGLQATGLFTLLLKPFQSNATLQRLFTYFWVGVILAFTQWLVLRRRTNLALAWVLATLFGTIIGRAAVFGLGNAIQPGTPLAAIAQSPFWFTLIVSLLSTLVLAALQGVVLAWRNYSRYWYWLALSLGASLVAFLGSYFINQTIGLVATGLITGLTLAWVLQTGLDESWVASPVEGEVTAPQLDKDSEIIAERMRQALGRNTRVTVYDDCMEIEPGAYPDRDLAQRLVTGRGQAQIFSAAQAPAEEAPAPQDSPVILSQDGIAAASVLSPNDPEEVRLKLELTEDGSAQVADFLKNDPDKGLYLALDEQVVIARALDVAEANVLELRGLAFEEASNLAAMLDNEPLSVGYEIED
ncbi:MAG: hypothetical protein PHQ40_13780 [Anaerolineaceae bacterium]|nr:hypothetical protein [Anaerolineaceae bacterium]